MKLLFLQVTDRHDSIYGLSPNRSAGSVLLNRAPKFKTVVGTTVLRDDLYRQGQILMTQENKVLQCNIGGIRSH